MYTFGGDCRRDVFVGSGTLVPASAVADDVHFRQRLPPRYSRWFGHTRARVRRRGRCTLSAATAAAAKRLAEKNMERVKGIEPSPKAWEAFVLPLYYTRII